MNMIKQDNIEAELYRQKILQEFPESKYLDEAEKYFREAMKELNE